mmetsp:Transcript_35974/g.99124  ORF Transcript_35974/g.99124 Transcript_35974/m.99124 type:complete len:385 (+) Transcript_35974:35-1189(+)
MHEMPERMMAYHTTPTCRCALSTRLLLRVAMGAPLLAAAATSAPHTDMPSSKPRSLGKNDDGSGTRLASEQFKAPAALVDALPSSESAERRPTNSSQQAVALEVPALLFERAALYVIVGLCVLLLTGIGSMVLWGACLESDVGPHQDLPSSAESTNAVDEAVAESPTQSTPCGTDHRLSHIEAAKELPPAPLRGCFCPTLVVPQGLEFVAVVLDVLTKGRQQVSFCGVDLNKSPLFHVCVDERSSTERCGICMQLTSGEPFGYILTGSLHDAPDGDGSALICQPSLELFGSLPNDGNRTLLDLAGEQVLTFKGNFAEKMINGIAPSGALVCATRPCTIDAGEEPHIPVYEVRVAPCVDAGLILCGLLALAKVEGCTTARGSTEP